MKIEFIFLSAVEFERSNSAEYSKFIQQNKTTSSFNKIIALGHSGIDASFYNKLDPAYVVLTTNILRKLINQKRRPLAIFLRGRHDSTFKILVSLRVKHRVSLTFHN